ncbi:putative membrane protein [Streptomyces viridochromogenes Tue57]|uniref:Putative membrane protein n=1 Tax=Streptomyces viridochromogenes Tue57 TaxID=1160705 RepID=L8PCE4_STRVR|nr:putative membrane protein [Streptomyces viridochromogenes Tue57]
MSACTKSATPSEFHQWMFRDFWRHLKSRHGL